MHDLPEVLTALEALPDRIDRKMVIQSASTELDDERENCDQECSHRCAPAESARFPSVHCMHIEVETLSRTPKVICSSQKN